MNIPRQMPKFSNITLKDLGVNESPQQIAYSADDDGQVTVELPSPVNISTADITGFSVVSVGLRNAATDKPEATFYNSDNSPFKVIVEKDNDMIVFPTVDLVG